MKSAETKKLTGMVVEAEEKDWWLLEFGELDGEDRLLLSPVQKIDQEWRFFVVAGEVVAGSQYRHDGVRRQNEPVSDLVWEEARRPGSSGGLDREPGLSPPAAPKPPARRGRRPPFAGPPDNGQGRGPESTPGGAFSPPRSRQDRQPGGQRRLRGRKREKNGMEAGGTRVPPASTASYGPIKREKASGEGA